MEPNSETKLYQVSKGCAQWKKIPIYFVARQLAETSKAVYLYGHGTVEVAKLGVCMICGRGLKHPVSVELGIGPECGQHYWDWDRVGGYTKENVSRLTKKIREDIIIDTWIPKGLIEKVLPTEEQVIIPATHPILVKAKENTTTTSGPITPVKTLSVTNVAGSKAIIVKFPYNVEDLAKVKSIPGRRFDADKKQWSVPFGFEAAEQLISWGFTADNEILNYVNKIKNPKTVQKDIEIPGLKRELFPFQREGVAFIEAHEGRALVADEMGLGKTIQALAYLQLHPEARPAVIVVPASLKLNWKKEIEMTLSKSNVQVLKGSQPYKIFGDIVIINYDILAGWVDDLKKINPQVLITDECHYFKNNSAQRTKAVKQLGKVVPSIIALSGTPIVNRPVEAFNAIHLIDPNLFPNAWYYLQRYCGAKNNGYGWDFSGATNTEELHEKLKGALMIRRLKKDVLKDLPDKMRSFVPMELDNWKEYDAAESDFIEFVRKTKGAAAADKASQAETLVQIEGLKQLAVRGKLENCIRWINDFLENENKLVIMTVHKFVIDELMKTYNGIAVKIDGSVSTEDRERAVQQFQNNPNIKIFVGNIKAAGVGITLTASNNVVFLELPWTPGELTQAEDRCHRIGQKDTVNIYYLLAADTIEEKLANIIDKKMKVLSSVLDGTELDQSSLLSELMKQYN